jgi:hypothetical protein
MLWAIAAADHGGSIGFLDPQDSIALMQSMQCHPGDYAASLTNLGGVPDQPFQESIAGTAHHSAQPNSC